MTAPTLFTAQDYQSLHAIVFATDPAGRPAYPGYRPTVVESPNGDGNQDRGKRFAHIAVKYLEQYPLSPDWYTLHGALVCAHNRALHVARALGVPDAYMPDLGAGALRVLEYPPGTGSHVHTDVGLLTLMCYRDQPDKFRHHEHHLRTAAVHELDPQMHLGRIAREIGFGPAEPHSVDPSDTAQHSIVYFAVPRHAATLPNGQRLGDWLEREMAKMRYDR